MTPLFLCRYDTEGGEPEEMAGFFEKAVEVHRADAIPATFFCRGGAIDSREAQFRAFWEEVKEDPLFDVQDHSYTHIGIGYEAGPSVEELRADYEKSFAAHERVFGKRPLGISICGTSGRDGAHLPGFDATEKATAEFEMLVALGVRMLNSFLTGIDGSREFCDYGRLDHADVMGFPSAFSDTEWMHRRACGDPVSYIKSVIDERAERGEHMPLMLHDWCAWNFAPDKELTHVRLFAHHARERGYDLATHAACIHRSELWQP
jgi:peptidoglycan/xylan/chitin deacetylase (PgdA/CDA1 family)